MADSARLYDVASRNAIVPGASPWLWLASAGVLAETCTEAALAADCAVLTLWNEDSAQPNASASRSILWRRD